LVLDVQEKQMTEDLTAEEVRAFLKLEPHATCVFVGVTARRWDDRAGCSRSRSAGWSTRPASYFW
jgi:hypothetical protein